jgi:UDP-3-O-[3-hydroxymyristoyl] N-acetylglucosamine deacetylase
LLVPCALSNEQIKASESAARAQYTLDQSASLSGIGLFSGQKVNLTIEPADSDTGILFVRTDLPEKPRIPANLDHVVSTPRCTILGDGQFTIHTVEHILAALRALNVDNAVIRLDGPEVPIMDGSAAPFVDLLLEAGIAPQEEAFVGTAMLTTPFFWSQGDVHLIALPSEEYRISYTLHYPSSDILRAQYCSLLITADQFQKEIAPCRTFCLYEEIAPFVQNGLVKGGSLDNAVIIKDDVVINPGGVRFPDEMARHKVLDIVGDLSLIPLKFTAHIIAIRSGHASNISFGRELYRHLMAEVD